MLSWISWIESLSAFELSKALKLHGLNPHGGVTILRERLYYFGSKELLEEFRKQQSTLSTLNGKKSQVSVAPKTRGTHRNLIQSWNIKFGDEARMDVEKFLSEIKDKQNGTDVTDEDLYEALPDLMIGCTKCWYRLERHRWDYWEDFIASLRANFDGPNRRVHCVEEKENRLPMKIRKRKLN